MNRADVEAIVKRYFDLRLTNDIDAICSVFADAVHFRISGAASPSELLAAGRVRQPIRPMTEAMTGLWHWLGYHIDEMLIDDDRAVVLFSAQIRFAPSGEVIDTEYCNFFKVENGGIVEFIEFCDTAHVNQLLTSLIPKAKAPSASEEAEAWAPVLEIKQDWH